MNGEYRYNQPPGERGSSFPLGATTYPTGTNFSLFCKHGTSVELLLFDSKEDKEPVRTIRLDPKLNRSYHYWHLFVPGISSGQLYAYRIEGPNDPGNGNRYDASQQLIDPYAFAVATPAGYRRSNTSTTEGRKSPAMKSVVVDLGDYNWENDKQLSRPFAQTIIYELHVGGFTRHPNSGVAISKRGTFLGLIEKIPYLVDLGITAVELLPVFQFDEQDSPDGLVNYWGYSPVSFFAPHQGYGVSINPLDVINEFRDMVKAFHRAGIEVILDVVYNHTAEGNQHGPTYCFRGIDNSVYYILEADKHTYANYSGTGNTLNANQPIVRRMIIDSLHFWVTHMHIDGFRFDLASILSRDESGNPLENPPVLWDIESDPELAGIKLIAEAWDAAGLYQVGSFIGDSWKEWNGKFRDEVRRFLRGDEGMVSHLVSRIVGSPDIYVEKDREPEQSINFVTCHDGFTLNDLVSYNHKHNEANNESNRDGTNENYSWNCGVEGSSTDPQVEALRNRQVKNFLTVTLISIGTPMISMGDEVRRTQHGNNNAYCHNNELTWFDWSLQKQHGGIHQFVKKLIGSRLLRDASKAEYSMSLNQLLEKSLVTWHGMQLGKPDWSHHSHTIAFTVQSLSGQIEMHFMLNAYHETLEFELPQRQNAGAWKRWIDTSLNSPEDISDWLKGPEIKQVNYALPAHSMVVLTSKL